MNLFTYSVTYSDIASDWISIENFRKISVKKVEKNLLPKALASIKKWQPRGSQNEFDNCDLSFLHCRYPEGS